MRVLWLSHFVPFPPRSGALQRSHNLLRQIAAHHEVHLVALQPRTQFLDEESANAALTALSAVCATIEIHAAPSDDGPVARGLLAAASLVDKRSHQELRCQSPGIALRARDLDAARRFDVIHVDTVGLAPNLSSYGGPPIVLNHHNVESHLAARRAAASGWQRLFWSRELGKIARLERTWCERAALNLVVSTIDEARLRDVAGAVQATVIANGVDIDFFTARAPLGHDGGGLVFVGGMDWAPNRDAARWFVDEIWPALLAENADRRAVIIGRDPPREVVRATSDPRLSAPGFVDDVRPFIDAASIYVCPLRVGGGTRLKVLDALAMAKPLVATSLAVEGLGLIEDVHYLRAETSSDFVAQIGRLELDTPLRRSLAIRGRELVVEKYRWEQIGARLEEGYRWAMERSRGKPPRSQEPT